RVSSQRLTRAMARLRKKYQKAKLLEAQVNLTQRTYRPETNTVEYTFDIVRGARVDVTVEGAKMRKGLVKKLVPVFEENAVDEDLLNEGRRNIEDYFQKQGYFDVKVSFSQPAASAGESRNVVYRVERGERHKFDTLAIGGNHYFPLDAIRERMAMQPAGGLRIYGFFSQSILARDIQAIDNLYRLNGFREIKITPTVQDDHGGKHGHVKVTISIEEGSQTTVGKLELQGNHAISTDEIMNMVSAREGQPYSEFNLANDQNEIMNLYFNAGFPETRFEYTSTIDPGDPHKIDVSYKITEGSQVFVDKVLVSGTHFTRGYVVDHAMKIRPGDALSQEKLLDTQRNLYDLGIFNSVEMAVQNPEGTATHKNVNLQLTEAKRYTFNYGFGFQVQTGQPAGAQEPQGKTGISPQVSFDITRLNFRGRDHTITLRSKYGNLEKLGLASYEAPRWFDFEHLTFNLTSFYQQTNDVRTFTAKRLEGSVEIKQEVTKAITLLYRLTYRRVSTDNLV
ncbi:MAG TPA: POTRA domain-containing protein, partial [Alphaproteobacteria bacterium]|nr:POTRA domain-containing protein [Alphaproteobacteria bacterium]